MPEVSQGASPNARFLVGTVVGDETSWKSYAQRATGSVLFHIAATLLVVFIATRTPTLAPMTQIFEAPKDITWIALPGPGGGGGGGGNRTPDPPRKAEIIAPKPRAVEPPKLEPPAPKPEPQMNIPAVTAVAELPGAVAALPDPTPAQGTGTGGGGGTGAGSGVGPGTGSGFGPGIGGGTGDGVYRPGNGVTSPVPIKEVKPTYTGDAMRARIQGIVVIEAVVMPDGSVGDVHIVRSLDSKFGLDQEALKALKQWRFRPGLRLGQPVPVLILMEMSFTIR